MPRRICAWLLSALFLALLLGVLPHRLSTYLDRQPTPAGFGRGLLQGALMPAALPNLLLGNDVTIYAAKNTGVPYKLGYTCGVNACGAFFFGLCFWRISRWKKGLSGPERRPTTPTAAVP